MDKNITEVQQARNEMNSMPKPKPSFAPVYAAMYPELAAIARKHGYALAVHGSLQRDFDLICIPWVDEPASPDAVMDEIRQSYAEVDVIDKDGVLKPHGRRVWSIAIGFGWCQLDLGFMPIHKIT